jgi:hypothetical protein
VQASPLITSAHVPSEHFCPSAQLKYKLQFISDGSTHTPFDPVQASPKGQSKAELHSLIIQVFW